MKPISAKRDSGCTAPHLHHAGTASVRRWANTLSPWAKSQIKTFICWLYVRGVIGPHTATRLIRLMRLQHA